MKPHLQISECILGCIQFIIQLQGSPATPVNSNSSAVSDPSAPRPLSEESDSTVDRAYYSRSQLENNDSTTMKNHEQRLHEINTLEWDELLVSVDPNKPITPQEGKTSGFDLQNQCQMSSYKTNNTIPGLRSLGGCDYLDNLNEDGLQMQDSFGRWINYIITDSPGSVDDQPLESSISAGYKSLTPPTNDSHGSSVLGQIFNITDVSPAWGFSNEETKILVVGFFHEGQLHVPESSVFVVCGDSMVPTVAVQSGVFRCSVAPQSPGSVNLYLSFDGHTPISQVLTFEFCAPSVHKGITPVESNSDWEKFRFQTRLAHLLFSSSKSLDIFSTKVSQNALMEAKDLAQKTSLISDNWKYLIKSIDDTKMPFPQAKESLFELTLHNKLQEWLLENVLAGRKISEYDEQGQGVIHLCAILGYTWAVYPYSWSGLSLDYRDKFGWTALHWAAYYGRERMVAILLSAGAKPNLVTDPTSRNPGGCTAADLASVNGYDGLAAYLAEKGLVAHVEDMTLAGNVSGSLQPTTNDSANSENCREEELYLKDTLAAYRTAADAAARIQSAFREHSFKLRTKEVQSSNPEIEARNIVAAMKIQHAFRNFDARKKITAAAQIQCRFRTWKMRKDFLNMRRQATRIQAVFRGFQVRKQYRKIVWSVGILEKAILRWRLKRKGFRGLQVQPDVAPGDENQDSDAEEDFFKASRKQAEERVERSVVRVQAMFRSKQAQEEYRRMKLAHNEAKLEYEGLRDPDMNMG
ncbi:calmodulin-binding transcription activator 5 isoform X4 [Olea europaea subsp. europaea]|uniref:Calmodulin-binding transcription activator 5 isoform X4 n=1 Tax=Olea europaea subsp. europaea TaxID=158383 RepID=A0A8S0VGM4_OLEEU|nr:calmodulin-binding transcription activator 5 isoform X4 [Olea europaea subsp. europaea]